MWDNPSPKGEGDSGAHRSPLPEEEGPVQPAPPAAETEQEPQAAISTERSHRTAEFFRSVAQLGIQAAEALEHAHQMGVVHRDIKPSNLMISLPPPSGRLAGGDGGCAGRGGEGPHLWITDFGLAMTQKDPALTMTGDIVGPLRCMSPEQVLGKRHEMDHRTDIYSLGVTLYELLTLRAAFAGDDREKLLRRLVEEDPPPPRSVNTSIPKDLETIVLKATAKEPAQRYATAQQMADDLRRFLADEPIRARRPSLADRAAKWARRHRPVVWSATASLLVVVAVLVVSAFLLFGAYQREREQRGLAAQNAAKANENYRKAREAVKQMLTRVADEEVGAIPEMKEVRKRLLEDAAAFYTELLKLNPNHAQAYMERGNVYMLLAKYRQARADFEKALDIQPDTAELQHALASFLVCCPDVAHRDLQRALVHAKLAVALAPRSSRYSHTLGLTYEGLRDSDNALRHLERAIDLDPQSATAYYLRTKIYWGRRDRDRALASAQKAVEVEPRNPECHRLLAEVYSDLGELEKALSAANRAVEVNPKPNAPTTFYIYAGRGNIFTALKDYDAALADYNKSIELAPFRSYTYKRRALVHFHLKHYDKALADIAKAVELKPDDVSNLRWIPIDLQAQCPDERFRRGILELADKTIQLKQGGSEVYVIRATLHATFGHRKEALADLEKSRWIRSAVRRVARYPLRAAPPGSGCGRLAPGRAIDRPDFPSLVPLGFLPASRGDARYGQAPRDRLRLGYAVGPINVRVGTC